MSCFEHGAGRSGSCQHAAKEGGYRDWCVLKLLQPNKTPRNKLYVYYNSYAFATYLVAYLEKGSFILFFWAGTLVGWRVDSCRGVRIYRGRARRKKLVSRPATRGGAHQQNEERDQDADFDDAVSEMIGSVHEDRDSEGPQGLIGFFSDDDEAPSGVSWGTAMGGQPAPSAPLTNPSHPDLSTLEELGAVGSAVDRAMVKAERAEEM
ncbi:hypothetical protein PC117_g8407 [Phytophthora cactorum]|uniref:Uncharacterized protein n=1 Tax=Phytophthora cactorum TaxID=29920 RepID=A0A8T1DWE2_9STRA|nr:hypothetical protein PC117_g8407 [Phytophthora cactorum]